MKKILFVQHNVSPPGGGAGVGAYMLDVLKEHGKVTLLSVNRFEPESVDDYYGTSLANAGIRSIRIKDPLLGLTSRLGVPNGLLTLHTVMKAAKRYLATHHDYDLVCSAADEQDLGVPCIQYIHYPWNLYPRPDAPPGWSERWMLRAIIRVYNWLCRCYSGFHPGRMSQNLTLANSAWTGEKTRQRYGDIDYLVMHPPALAEQVEGDPSRRQPRFLSIGRCAPEKRWIELIDIVAALRERGHQVGLTLAGSRDRKDYEDRVRDRMAKAGTWVERKIDFTRDELQELLVTHRYGLHGMLDEHYGMAVAELILGGCLTSVHDDGGQVEIVTNPKLRYRSVEDAIEKWDTILSSESLQSTLLQEQLDRRDHLKKERFVADFDETVRLCLERGVPGVIRGLRDRSLNLGTFSKSESSRLRDGSGPNDLL